MERQDHRASTPPCTQQPASSHHRILSPTHHRREARDTSDTTRRDISSESRQSSTSPSSNQDPLSTSEPSLRFPRPVGNSHLANWISTSDPDIMRILSEATDDAGLADSTYELITGADDSDNWSQDGNDNECISESVSSLDPRRSDDVQSLADTEQNTDDEFTPVPIERVSRTSPSAVLVSKDHPLPANTGNHDSEDNSEDGRASRSSLDYTQQSLGTPSISTPEASKILPNPEEDEQPKTLAVRIHHEVQRFRVWLKENMEYLHRGLEDGTVSVYHPVFLAFSGLQVLLLAVIGTYVLSSMGFTGTNISTTQVPDVVTTTTEAPLLLTSSASSTTPSKSLASSSTGTALTLRDDGFSNEWFFGSKRPNVTFSSPSGTSFLAHIPEDAKGVWTYEQCVTFTASRDGQLVANSVSTVREGLLMRIPRRHAYGTIDLVLDATCKPSLRKVVKARFSRGILEEWVESTTSVAKSLMTSPLQTVNEAQRGLAGTWMYLTHDLRRYASSTSSAFSSGGLPGVLDSVLSSTWNNVAQVGCNMRNAVGTIHEYSQQAVDAVHDTQTSLQLGLLQAQIAAKLSWLSVIGKTEEHAEYKRKATAYLAEKQALAGGRQAGAVRSTSSPWSSLWKTIVGPTCPNVRWLNDKVAICE